MSDIEYTIRRFKDGEFTEAVRFTESELKRRLAYIAGWPIEEIGSMEREIEVLLHGEGEKWEKPAICKFHTKLSPEEAAQFEQQIGAEKAMRALSGDQPSPAPTREEWEAWVDNIPVTLDCKLDVLNTHDFRAWFLSMPIVPKE